MENNVLIEPLNLRGCIHDAPSFRIEMQEHERVASLLESSYLKLVKLGKQSVDSGKVHCEKNISMLKELRNCTKLCRFPEVLEISSKELNLSKKYEQNESDCFKNNHKNVISFNNSEKKNNSLTFSSLEQVFSALLEVETRRVEFLKHSEEVFIKPIESFLTNYFFKSKEAGRQFESSSSALENSLEKYLGRKPNDTGIPEAARDVTEARKAHHEISLDYSISLNNITAKSGVETADFLLSLAHTTLTHSKLCSESMRDIEPLLRVLGEHLNVAKTKQRLDSDEMIRQRLQLLQSHQNMYNPMHQGLIENVIGSSGTFKQVKRAPSENKALKIISMLKPNKPNSHCDDLNMKDNPVFCLGGVNSVVLKSGYLFKKNQMSRMRHSWSRRYFTILNELLVYSQRGKETEPVVAMNLRYSTVKLAEQSIERRYVFHVISSQKSYSLQAENEEDMHSWIESLQRGILIALQSDSKPSNLGIKGKNEKEVIPMVISPKTMMVAKEFEEQRQIIESLKKIPGNTTCADCETENPEWASINYGILLCIECSGIHRQLGVQVSKVRSLVLDKLDPETVKLMSLLGNDKVNLILDPIILHDISKEESPDQISNSINNYKRSHQGSNESQISKESEDNLEDDWKGGKRLKSTASRKRRENYIVAKYANRSFVQSQEIDPTMCNMLFWDSSAKSDIISLLTLLQLGANVDYHNEKIYGRTALHHAIANNITPSYEFLMQWQANIEATDINGWTALHYCAASNNTRLLMRLLKRAANIKALDISGATPLDVAVARTSVQAVTILRLYCFQSGQAGRASVEGALLDVLADIETSDPGLLDMVDLQSVQHGNIQRPNRILPKSDCNPIQSQEENIEESSICDDDSNTTKIKWKDNQISFPSKYSEELETTSMYPQPFSASIVAPMRSNHILQETIIPSTPPSEQNSNPW